MGRATDGSANPDRAQIVSQVVGGGAGAFDIGVQFVDPSALAYDPLNAKLYWVDPQATAIIRPNLDRPVHEPALGLSNQLPFALAPVPRNLYCSTSVSS